MLAAGAAAGMIAALARRPTLFQTAVEADRQLGLHDLLATALMLPACPRVDESWAATLRGLAILTCAGSCRRNWCCGGWGRAVGRDRTVGGTGADAGLAFLNPADDPRPCRPPVSTEPSVAHAPDAAEADAQRSMASSAGARRRPPVGTSRRELGGDDDPNSNVSIARPTMLVKDDRHPLPTTATVPATPRHERRTGRRPRKWRSAPASDRAKHPGPQSPPPVPATAPGRANLLI